MSVVVGYIPTREGRAALRRAAVECRLRTVDLVVIQSASSRYDADDTDRFEAVLEGVRSELAGAGVSVDLRQGSATKDAAEDLIDEAQSCAAELIVIGLRRRTPVGKLILGSNAQRILLDATCPVMAVKAGAQDD